MNMDSASRNQMNAQTNDQKLDSDRALEIKNNEESQSIVESNAGQEKETLPESFAKGRFQVIKKLGQGAYGQVFKCLDKAKNRFVAIKRLTRFPGTAGIPATSIREFGILCGLKSCYLVNLLMIEQDTPPQNPGSNQTGSILLVFEMLDYDLHSYVGSTTSGIPSGTVKHVTYQLLQAVHFLHQNRVFHRDIKPANILISRDEAMIKLADFGLSRNFHQPFRPYSCSVATLMFRAPELCSGKKDYSIGVDIWAVACTMACMATGKYLFWDGKATTDLEVLNCIFRILGAPSPQKAPNLLERLKKFGELTDLQNEGEGLKAVPGLQAKLGDYGMDLISRMLELDQERRISSFQALQHPYFSQF